MGETGFISLWLQLNTWNQWWRMKGGGVQLHLRKALSNTGSIQHGSGPLGGLGPWEWTDTDASCCSNLVKARINPEKTRLLYKALTRKGVRASGNRAKTDIWCEQSAHISDRDFQLPI